jgi:arylsulfatase A-like enzyme
VARAHWKLIATVAVAAITTSAFGDTPRKALPVPQTPFKGVIKDLVANSTPSPTERVRAPVGAPNILLFMSDDVGFASSSAFGGPIPTPNFDRLAAMGERYNRFHTTGICSPTRAALLTGRNHHNAGTGHLADLPSGYPGYDVHFRPDTATIAQTLKLNGYNTAMFGKHHNVRPGEDTIAGPFDDWPTGIGFEYFYGFVGGDSDQWSPNLVRGTNAVSDPKGPPELLDKRLADDAIRWIQNQKAAAPDKPFFVYYAPGSLHAPHQARPEDIARFKGKFDMGWDQQREDTFKRQLALGIIPQGTKLTPRPDGIPAWSSLSVAQKAFAARTMEVAAAMLAYQDEQVGRVLNELERMGVLDNTLVIAIQGDNGASGEGGPTGTVNEIGTITDARDESEPWLASNIGALGGENTYENYPVGWAWALNTPFRWTKQYASMLGGIRNGMIISWKGHIARPDSICSEFGHVVDIAPTVFEAAGVLKPDTVFGIIQKPLDGRSLLSSLTACQPDRPRTQYFEITGKAGLYSDGWFASADDGRKPWDQVPPSGFDPASPKWELYDLRSDFSQATDLAAQNPDKLASLKATWHDQAAANHVFPLDHRFSMGRGQSSFQSGKHFDYWGNDISLPAARGPMFVGRSFTLDAEFKLDKPRASGVIFALGSRFAGWSLFLDQGRPTLVYARSTRPEETVRIEGKRVLPAGAGKLSVKFTSEGFGKGGQFELSMSDATVATGHVPKTFLTPAGLGEMLNTGRDSGVTVTDYRTPHGELEGEVSHVSLDFK